MRYVVVEGVIGVGKTTLARQLARALGGQVVLEAFDENPFLPDFYREPRAHALSAQLFFLMSRFRQLENLAQIDLFAPGVFVDYLFEKDRIFAELTLGPEELKIHQHLFAILAPRVPRPDLVIYLRADVPHLLARIAKRGRSYEKEMDPGYLKALDEAYAELFRTYRVAPVIEIATEDVDLRNGGAVVDTLVQAIRTGQVPPRLGPESTGTPELPRLGPFS